MPALCLAVFIWWCLKVTAVLSQCWAGLGPCGEHRSVLPQYLGSPSLPHFPKHSKWNPVTMTIVKVKRKGDASKGLPVTWQECTEEPQALGMQGRALYFLTLVYEHPRVFTALHSICPAASIEWNHTTQEPVRSWWLSACQASLPHLAVPPHEDVLMLG